LPIIEGWKRFAHRKKDFTVDTEHAEKRKIVIIFFLFCIKTELEISLIPFPHRIFNAGGPVGAEYV
jgi:hypothetical protein